MATATEAPAAIPAATEIPENLYLLNVDEYERIGSLLDTEKVELIDGFLVKKMTINPPHAVTCSLTEDVLRRAAPDGWFTRAGAPVRIPKRSYPEPDVSLIRGQPRDYSKRHPRPADVALVVEVTDTTLAKDRRRVRIYGAARIPFYWLINLPAGEVEVYSRPTAKGYMEKAVLKPGDSIPLVIDGVKVGSVSVSDLFP